MTELSHESKPGTICLSLLVDEDCMPRGTGRVSRLADMRHRNRSRTNARFIPFVPHDERLVRKLLHAKLNAQLSAVDAAPDKAFSVRRDRDGVVRATVDHDNTFTAELRDLHRVREDIAERLIVASFAEAVQTPGPDLVPAVDGEGVERARNDILDVVPSDLNASGHEARLLAARQEVTAELVLLALAPRPDVTASVQSECVVGPAGDLRDVLQSGEEMWSGLFLDELAGAVIEEAGLAVATLVCVSKLALTPEK